MKRRRWFLMALMIGVLVLTARPGFSIYGDVVFQREKPDASAPPATFPHWFHRIRFACSVCHPGISPMENKPGLITMDKISRGQYCGVCHNGKVAFAPSFDTCRNCHQGF